MFDRSLVILVFASVLLSPIASGQQDSKNQSERTVATLHRTLRAFAEARNNMDAIKIRELLSSDSPFQDGYISRHKTLSESYESLFKRHASLPPEVAQKKYGQVNAFIIPSCTVLSREVAYVDSVFGFRNRDTGQSSRRDSVVFPMRREAGVWMVSGMLNDAAMVQQASERESEKSSMNLQLAIMKNDPQQLHRCLNELFLLPAKPTAGTLSEELTDSGLSKLADVLAEEGESFLLEHLHFQPHTHLGFSDSCVAIFDPGDGDSAKGADRFEEQVWGYSDEDVFRLAQTAEGQLELVREFKRTSGLGCVGRLTELAAQENLHSSCCEFFASCLDKEPALFRRLAAHLMGLAGRKVGQEELIQALEREKDIPTRRTFVRAMGLIGGESFVPSLEKVLEEDDDKITRIYAHLAKLRCEGREFAVVDRI